MNAFPDNHFGVQASLLILGFHFTSTYGWLPDTNGDVDYSSGDEVAMFAVPDAMIVLPKAQQDGRKK